MSYQLLVQALTQLEEDQTLFEAELGHELKGPHHEQLVRLGGKMCQKARLLADLGPFSNLQMDFLTKVTDAIHEYQHLIIPPKVFRGFCPCLKPARTGPEYERNFFNALSKVVSALFLCEVLLIKYHVEKLSMESMHFLDYANKMNSIQTTLGDILTDDKERVKEGCRIELLASVEAVHLFLELFEADTEGFKTESDERITHVNEILSPGMEGSRSRIHVDALGNLQMIMNCAAYLSMKRSKDSLALLEMHRRGLTSVWEIQQASFIAMESTNQEESVVDLLNLLIRESEVANNDAACHLNNAVKRWKVVQTLSLNRPVATYEENLNFTFTSQIESVQTFSRNSTDRRLESNNSEKGQKGIESELESGIKNDKIRSTKDYSNLSNTSQYDNTIYSDSKLSLESQLRQENDNHYENEMRKSSNIHDSSDIERGREKGSVNDDLKSTNKNYEKEDYKNANYERYNENEISNENLHNKDNKMKIKENRYYKKNNYEIVDDDKEVEDESQRERNENITTATREVIKGQAITGVNFYKKSNS